MTDEGHVTLIFKRTHGCPRYQDFPTSILLKRATVGIKEIVVIPYLVCFIETNQNTFSPWHGSPADILCLSSKQMNIALPLNITTFTAILIYCVRVVVVIVGFAYHALLRHIFYRKASGILPYSDKRY